MTPHEVADDVDNPTAPAVLSLCEHPGFLGKPEAPDQFS
jgi:hypothetical protein